MVKFCQSYPFRETYIKALVPAGRGGVAQMIWSSERSSGFTIVAGAYS
jgi:hypothetical protein